MVSKSLISHRVRTLNQTFAELKLSQHPDKTFIGRIEKGFDFLGYRFDHSGLTVAKQTMQNFVERAARLYEQERDAPCRRSPLERYVRRWLGWAYGGLSYDYESKRELSVAKWVALQLLCTTADACAPTRLRLPDIA